MAIVQFKPLRMEPQHALRLANGIRRKIDDGLPAGVSEEHADQAVADLVCQARAGLGPRLEALYAEM